MKVSFCQDGACSHRQVGHSTYSEATVTSGLYSHPSDTYSNTDTFRADKATLGYVCVCWVLEQESVP